MDNLNDLRAAWQSADTSVLPDVKTITRIVKRYRNQKIRNKILSIAVSVFVVIFFAVLIFLHKSPMLTTLIADCLFIIAFSILAYTNIRSIKRFYVFNSYSNKDYLAFLEQTRKNQLYYYKRTQVISMSVYSVALPLYLFEHVYKYTLLAVISYTLTLAFLLIFWLVTRPKTYKKEALKLQQMIDRTAAIASQIN